MFSHTERDISEFVQHRESSGVAVHEPQGKESVGELPPNIPFALNRVHEEPQAPPSILGQVRQLTLKQIADGQMFIYLFGHISYKDIFGKAHYTDFCGIWNPKVGGFDMCPTYNTAE